MPPESTAVAQPRSRFLELMSSVGDGSLESDASDVVRELIAKITTIGEASGGKPVGKLTLTVSVGGRFASPTDLLELSRSLQVNVSSVVKNAVTLQSGEIAVAYTEVHNDGEGKPIKVPNLFVIGIPVFVDGPRWRMAARLRYRLQGGKILWSYSLVKAEQSFDDAFKEVVGRVADATEIPVFYGEPEAAQ